jgi:hypothetical protein
MKQLEGRQENKNSYFILFVDVKDNQDIKDVFALCDLVLSSMKASYEKTLKYTSYDKKKVIILFGLEFQVRKRDGQLLKICKTIFKQSNVFASAGITQTEFHQNQEDFYLRIKQKKMIFSDGPSEKIEQYSGRDIQHLIDAYNTGLKGFFPWQKDFIRLFFNCQTNEIKQSDNRYIYNFIDPRGCSGKSSLIKFIRYTFSDRYIAQIPISSTAQLRSALTKLGPKKLYIVDLPRQRETGGSQNIQSVITALEDVKNGNISSNFYGKSGGLLFDIPAVVIMSNFPISDEVELSADRWRCYEILASGRLGKLNQLLKKKKLSKKIATLKKA